MSGHMHTAHLCLASPAKIGQDLSVKCFMKLLTTEAVQSGTVFAAAVVLVPMCSLTKDCVCTSSMSPIQARLPTHLRCFCLSLHSRETQLYGPKSHWCLIAESSQNFILQDSFTDWRFSLLLFTLKNASTTFKSRNDASQNLTMYKTK